MGTLQPSGAHPQVKGVGWSLPGLFPLRPLPTASPDLFRMPLPRPFPAACPAVYPAPGLVDFKSQAGPLGSISMATTLPSPA